MPRQFTYREVTKSIEAKLGIVFGAGGERSGWYFHEGVKITRITLPHVHKGTLPPGTFHSIRKQMLLSTSEFESLIDCPMTSQGYRDALRQKGRLG